MPYSKDFYNKLTTKGLEPVAIRNDVGESGRAWKGLFTQAGNMMKAGAGIATGRDEWVYKGVTYSKLDVTEFGGDTENFTDIDNVGSAASWLSYQAGARWVVWRRLLRLAVFCRFGDEGRG